MLSHFINILNIPYKFSIDLMWNCGSFVVMGICGIAINIIIAKTYGLEILGVFNQVYAIYILISQFSTGGVQFSVLKNIAIYSGNKKVSSMILVSGLLLAIIYPIPFIIIIFFLKECVGELLKSKGVSVGILYILPGIFFFSINKIFLAFHNGRRRMKSFAIFQSIRYLGILAALLFFAIISFDGYKISMAFTISEIILFALISLYSIRYLKIHFSKEILKWLRIHFYFGIKGILGNVYAELNTRADVIMLGFFCSDRSVGIYSFAAMLAEGFGQIATIVQVNLNPIISKTYFTSGAEALEEVIEKGKKKFHLLFIILGILIIIMYPLFLYILGLNVEYMESWTIFIILAFGLMLSGGYLPLRSIFTQTGFPGYQTIFLLLILIINILLNLILIPYYGVFGAATATSLSVVSQIFFLKKYTRKCIGINI